MLGTAMDTIVWSMKIIATAKIIAARTTPFDRTPVALLTVMAPPQWRVPVLTAWANSDVSLPYVCGRRPRKATGRSGGTSRGAATFVWAVGQSGASGSFNPLVLQNG